MKPQTECVLDLSYDSFFSFVKTINSNQKSLSKEDQLVAYGLLGQKEFNTHAISLYYADRKVFDTLTRNLLPLYLNFEKHGLGLSTNHIQTLLICCEQKNIKQFASTLRNQLNQIPTNILRFTCRVMKNRKTINFIVDMMLRHPNELITRPSQLFFIEQFFAKDLPEQYSKVSEKLNDIYNDFCKNPADLSLAERNILDDLTLHYTNSYKLNKKSHVTQLTSPATIFGIISNKPKVALCLSGQLRGYEQTHEKMGSFFDAFGVDRYVNVWSDIGRGMLVPDRADRWFSGSFLDEFRTLCSEGKLSGKSFLQMYPAFSSISGPVDPETVKSIYNTSDVIIEDDVQDLPSNHHKMFYQIWQCHRQMMSSSKNYDVVIRIRPDLAFDANAADWDGILYRAAREKIVWVETEFGTNRVNGWVGDQFAIGSMEAISTYASIYPLAQKVDIGQASTPIGQAHETLGYHMWKNGYAMPRAPIANSKLVETAKFSAGDLERLLKATIKDEKQEVHSRLTQANRMDLASIS